MSRAPYRLRAKPWLEFFALSNYTRALFARLRRYGIL